MEDIFKSYGSAIGPTIAFLLGILALFIKNRVDISLAKRQAVKKFSLLKNLIKNSPPPKKYYPGTSESGFIHADEARNMTNIARFYNRLLATKTLLQNLEGEIYRHGSIGEIRQFNNIKWWHDILFKDVENVREEAKVDINSFNSLGQSYILMKAACDNPDQLFDYIE